MGERVKKSVLNLASPIIFFQKISPKIPIRAPYSPNPSIRGSYAIPQY